MALTQTHFIVVAAGSGSRFGSDIPKQFVALEGRPVVMHAIEALLRAFPDAGVTLVINKEYEPLWQRLCREHGFVSPSIACGGATRWESVKNGLAALPGSLSPSTVIMIHDGARPLVDVATVRRVAAACVNTDGAIPAIDVTDSLRRMEDDGVHSVSVDRSDFRAVQTPQGFALWRLRQAYALPYESTFTDDASVMAAAGFANIILVRGDVDNIKITNPRDLAIASALMHYEVNKG